MQFVLSTDFHVSAFKWQDLVIAALKKNLQANFYNLAVICKIYFFNWMIWTSCEVLLS